MADISSADSGQELVPKSSRPSLFFSSSDASVGRNIKQFGRQLDATGNEYEWGDVGSRRFGIGRLLAGNVQMGRKIGL
ncbi:hypothetical protein V6N13_080278 [Hibiscus sabdariffa]